MKILFVVNIFMVIIVASLADTKDTGYIKTSSVVSSSNYQSSSSNVNGKVTSHGTSDSTVVHGSADGISEDGKLKDTRANVEGASINSRFSYDDEKGLDTSVNKQFVQIKKPSNRPASGHVQTYGLSSRFSDSEKHPPTHPVDHPPRSSESDSSEDLRILDETIQYLNYLTAGGSRPTRPDSSDYIKISGYKHV